MHRYTFCSSTHLSIDTVCFHLLVNMNNGAVNMCVQISLWVPVFRSLGRKSKHEIAQSCGNSFFFFNRNRRAPKLGPQGTCLGRGVSWGVKLALLSGCPWTARCPCTLGRRERVVRPGLPSPFRKALRRVSSKRLQVTLERFPALLTEMIGERVSERSLEGNL